MTRSQSEVRPLTRRFNVLALSVLTILLAVAAVDRALARDGYAGAAANSEPALTIPANSYSTNVSYGRGWDCSYGFREAEGACILIVAPANAHINSYGERWTCDRGYKSVDQACVAILVPENAYLSDDTLGRGWDCERGYRAVNGACEAIEVPLNAYVDGSSFRNGWTCDRGYRAVAGACAAVVVPDNAHIDTAGDGWDCNRPYYRTLRDSCELR